MPPCVTFHEGQGAPSVLGLELPAPLPPKGVTLYPSRRDAVRRHAGSGSGCHCHGSCFSSAIGSMCCCCSSPSSSSSSFPVVVVVVLVYHLNKNPWYHDICVIIGYGWFKKSCFGGFLVLKSIFSSGWLWLVQNLSGEQNHQNGEQNHHSMEGQHLVLLVNTKIAGIYGC